MTSKQLGLVLATGSVIHMAKQVLLPQFIFGDVVSVQGQFDHLELPKLTPQLSLFLELELLSFKHDSYK